MKKFVIKELFNGFSAYKIAIVLFCVLLETVFVCCFVVLPIRNARQTDVKGEGFVIVLDAGHGGEDSGVVGKVTGVKESELNLKTCKVLKSVLEERGATVVMTRKDDNGLYGLATKGFKLRDMERRREIIIDAKPDLVVSIHMNKFSSPSRKGAQVFFQKGDQKSKVLADSIQRALNAFSGNGYAALSGDFYICRCTDVPSVIVECGFLSNPEEEKLLSTAEYRKKLANEIMRGIFLYLYSV